MNRLAYRYWLTATDLPHWSPDWTPDRDPRFFWPGREPGVTGCFNETTRLWDFVPAQRWVPSPGCEQQFDDPDFENPLVRYRKMMQQILKTEK